MKKRLKIILAYYSCKPMAHKHILYGGRQFCESKLALLSHYPDADQRAFRIAVDIPGTKGAKAYTCFNSQLEVVNYVKTLPKEDRCLYEVGATEKGKYPEKIKIDFDVRQDQVPPHVFKYIQLNGLILLQMALKAVLKNEYKVETTDADLCVTTSCTTEKVSYHVTVKRYCVANNEEAKYVRNLVSDWVHKNVKEKILPGPWPENTIDPAPYGQFQCFRLLWCCKSGKNNYKKRITQDVPSATFFTVTKGMMVLPARVESRPTVPRVVVEVDNSNPDRVEEVRKLLALLPDEVADEYKSWIEVCWCLHSMGEEYRELFHEFSARSDKYDEEYCEKLWEQAKPTDTLSGKGFTHRTLYGMLKKAGETNPDAKEFFRSLLPQTTRDALDEITPPSKFNQSQRHGNPMEEYSERYVRPIPSSGSYIIKSYLGTGKTTQIANQPEITNKNLTVLALSPRCKFARSLATRLGLPCYMDLKAREISNSRRLVLSMESLHKLEGNVNFDLVIGDEIESCLTQFISEATMKGKAERNMEIFSQLLARAKRFILADAFISYRTLDVMGCLSLNYTLVHNTYNPAPRRAILVPMTEKGEGKKKTYEPDALFQKLLELLKVGKRLYFVCASKKRMLQFERMVIEAGIVYKAYHSGSTDTKGEFDNVNETWGQFQLVMTTTTITVGINHDTEHFDCLALYGVIGSGSVRDLFQALMRVRHARDGDLYYSINPFSLKKPLSTRPEIFALLDAREEAGGELAKEYNVSINWKRSPWVEATFIYSVLEANAGQEQFSALVERYLDICGYTRETDANAYDELEVDQESSTDTFDSIVDISDREANEIAHRLKRATATAEEKNRLVKYNFKGKFDLDQAGEKGLRGIADLFDLIHYHGEKSYSKYLHNIRREGSKGNDIRLEEELLAEREVVLVDSAILKNEIVSMLTQALTIKDSLDTETKIEKFVIDALDGAKLRKDLVTFGLRVRADEETDGTHRSKLDGAKRILSSWSNSTLVRHRKQGRDPKTGRKIDVSYYYLEADALLKSLQPYLKPLQSVTQKRGPDSNSESILRMIVGNDTLPDDHPDQ